MKTTSQIMQTAFEKGILVPAFNVPYLPMIKPIIEALRDENTFGLVEVARLEWEKFQSKGYKEVYEEYSKYQDERVSRIHLDHVPVIDEDFFEVDYMSVIKGALAAGYQSVMVDGSRLSLEENISAVRKAADAAHEVGVPIEAELGKVMGHEAGEPMPYEELFKSGLGFTSVDEAKQFVDESRCDWLSVAVGNIHGAISAGLLDKEKPAARIDIKHLKKLKDAVNIPLVLHGGSGIPRDYILEAAKNGIAKINVGTELRQAYEKASHSGEDIELGRKACYDTVRYLVRDYFNISGSAGILNA